MARRQARRAARKDFSASLGQQDGVPAGALRIDLGGGGFVSITDPVPLAEERLSDYLCTTFNGTYYEPPISFKVLARLPRANPHHGSAISFKLNMLCGLYVESPLLSHTDFRRIAYDFLVFGNAFFSPRRNLFGTLIKLQPLLTRWTRVAPDGAAVIIREGGQLERLEPQDVCLLINPDLEQELYGTPEAIGGLHSALLNIEATCFRRKFYLNGSHTGYILQITDPGINKEQADAIRLAMKQSKGPGNFRNLLLHSPSGKPDGVKVIPISEVAAKDDFAAIKSMSRDDVLAAHRVPPQLLGIIPTNAGGFGSVGEASRYFVANELASIMTALTGINGLIGQQAVQFRDYAPPT